MRKLRIDPSWEGKGGIGRFYKEVGSSLKYTEKLKKISFPASPFATIFYTFQSLFYNSNDIFLYFGYIPPLYSKQKFYFVIYDLNHLDVSYNSSFIKRLYYKLVIKPGCHRAEKIFTISKFSQKRIVEWSGVDNLKVINVNCGVSEVFFKNEGSFSIGFKYIFCPTNRKKHKNENALIRSFSLLREKNDIHLVFTGAITEELSLLLESLNIQKYVHFLGYLSEVNLAELYKGAEMVAFPSLYEGFGLPVLEAMASNTPVLTSNTTSLLEIAGGAAHLVDPTDEKSIFEGMLKILNDEDYARALVMKGKMRANKYVWSKTSELVGSSINADYRSD